MNRVGLAVAVAALACGGCSGGDSAGGVGVDWAATQSLPTRDYGEAVTGNQYTETGGAITDVLWVVGEDAPADVSAQPNRALLELPETAPAGVIGLWVVSQIVVQRAGEWGDWNDVHAIFFPWGGAGWSSPVPAAPARVTTHGLLLLSAFASTDTANQRAATLLVDYGIWSGNGQISLALRGLPGVPFPPAHVFSETNPTGVAIGGVPARYRIVVRPASIGW